MPGLSEQRYTPEEFYSLTTDPEEGRRQIEAMQPPKLQVGDKVRLSAGGERIMTVVGLKDYGNKAECEWREFRPEGLEADKTYSFDDLSGKNDLETKRDTFPVRSLVLVDEPKVG